MDYTCENCVNRYTWDCDDGYVTHKCSDFRLDENTISEKEREIIRAIRYTMKNKSN